MSDYGMLQQSHKRCELSPEAPKSWPPTSAQGLGCAKTRACCGAVEFDSQTPDILASSREAHVTLFIDGRPQRYRKLGGSHTFRARLPFAFMLPRVVRVGDQTAEME
jgi:hypothetical protein